MDWAGDEGSVTRWTNAPGFAASREQVQAFSTRYWIPFLKELGSVLTGAKLRGDAPAYDVALAEGGTMQKRGRALVGEDGPEVLDLPQGAIVTPIQGRPLPPSPRDPRRRPDPNGPYDPTATTPDTSFQVGSKDRAKDSGRDLLISLMQGSQVEKLTEFLTALVGADEAASVLKKQKWTAGALAQYIVNTVIPGSKHDYYSAASVWSEVSGRPAGGGTYTAAPGMRSSGVKVGGGSTTANVPTSEIGTAYSANATAPSSSIGTAYSGGKAFPAKGGTDRISTQVAAMVRGMGMPGLEALVQLIKGGDVSGFLSSQAWTQSTLADYILSDLLPSTNLSPVGKLRLVEQARRKGAIGASSGESLKEKGRGLPVPEEQGPDPWPAPEWPPPRPIPSRHIDFAMAGALGISSGLGLSNRGMSSGGGGVLQEAMAGALSGGMGGGGTVNLYNQVRSDEDIREIVRRAYDERARMGRRS